MRKNRYHTNVERVLRSLHSTKMDCLNAKFRRNLVSTGHPFKEQSKNSPRKEFMEMGKSGGPRKTTARDDTTMKRIVTRSPTSSCKKLRAHLLKKGIDVSISTVSRRFEQRIWIKPVKKPKLKRLEFARKHLHWTVDDSGKVLFSDESSTFQQFVVRHKHVRRPVGERFDQKYTRWYGVPWAKMEQLNCIFWHLARPWMEPNTWKYCKISSYCIWQSTTPLFLCRTVLCATDPKLWRNFWGRITWQRWIGLAIVQIWTPLKIRGLKWKI